MYLVINQDINRVGESDAGVTDAVPGAVTCGRRFCNNGSTTDSHLLNQSG